MKILELGDNDLIGRRFNGFDLHRNLRAVGIDARCLVMSKQSEDDTVREYCPFVATESFTKNLFFEPWLLDADICHCHLMHNTPFDFNYLPLLSRLKPFVFTIHDPWLLGGHCIHHFECGKWRTGCFDCTNLGVDFGVPFDMTALNWRLKQDAFSQSDVALIVTSKWMDAKIEGSPFLREKRRYHIPFGIDQGFFSPGDKMSVRERFGIPKDNLVIMTLDQPDSPWKGGDIKAQAIEALADTENVSLILVGRRPGARKRISHYSQYEFEWTDDQELLRDLYRASDVYLMPSRAETFGMMAIEAMSCGVVVMTIPGTALEEVITAPDCGISVAERDFADRLQALLKSREEICERGKRSRQYAVDHYSFDRHLAAVKRVYEDEVRRFRRRLADERLLLQLQKHRQTIHMDVHSESVSSCVRPSSVDVSQPVPKMVYGKRKRLVQRGVGQSNPPVSVVIPVYNGANYLRHAIDSALAQTYDNLEVIVVNDGSSDGGETERIAKSYGDRIRYFAKENGGVSSALNLGIEKMSGEYFSWLSHDDMYYPEKIADQVSRLTSDDGSEIVYSGFDLVDEQGRLKGTLDPRSVVPRSKETVALFVLLHAALHGCAMLIPRELFLKYGMFDLGLRSTQDYALWWEFFRHPEVRLTYSPFRGVMSRQHAGQGTNTIPDHVAACCDLWIGMMDGLDSSGRERVYGNDYAFYHRIGENLAVISNYTKAVEHARRKTVVLEPVLARLVWSKSVSVIIPFCNRIGDTIKALKSVLEQSFCNLEVLLVDDGSTIDVSAVRRAASADSRVKYIAVKRGETPCAMNLAVGMSTGDFVAFMDSDSVWQPAKVESQLRYMLANGYEFSCCDYVRSRGGFNATFRMECEGNGLSRLVADCRLAPSTVMVSRAIVSAGLLDFQERVRYGADSFVWLRAAHEYEVGVLHEPLVRVSDDELVWQNGNGQQQPVKMPCRNMETGDLTYSEERLVALWRSVKENIVFGTVWKWVKAAVFRFRRQKQIENITR